MTDDHDYLEEKIRKASEVLPEPGTPTEPNTTELEKVSRRANRELVVRDAMHLGFGHLLTTFLTLLAGIHRYLNNLKKEKAKDGQS